MKLHIPLYKMHIATVWVGLGLSVAFCDLIVNFKPFQVIKVFETEETEDHGIECLLEVVAYIIQVVIKLFKVATYCPRNVYIKFFVRKYGLHTWAPVGIPVAHW